MKKLLITLLILMAVPFTSTANTLSHRYQIPDTNYSIEFPWYFSVFSSNMNKYEPIVWEGGLSFDEAKEHMSSSKYQIEAAAPDDNNNIGIYVFIGLEKFEHALGFSFEDLSDEEFEEFADEYVSKRYKLRPNVSPLFKYDISSVFDNGYLRFINFCDAFNEELSAYAEYFVLVDKFQSITIIVQYYNYDDFGPSSQSLDIVADIINSVRADYMEYPDT